MVEDLVVSHKTEEWVLTRECRGLKKKEGPSDNSYE